MKIPAGHQATAASGAWPAWAMTVAPLAASHTQAETGYSRAYS